MSSDQAARWRECFNRRFMDIPTASKTRTEHTSPSSDSSVTSTNPATADSIVLREPCATDGAALHRLIAACPPLDPNSMYCNLLQCADFSDTSVAAERNGELMGFISGYIPPRRPDTLFIWQVAVSTAARGMGLGKRMLSHLLDRTAPRGVRYLDTTITEDNAASWALFQSLARDRNAACNSHVHFDREQHFDGSHDSELLLRIGPFSE